jgi:anthranilate synthase/aminodeoxychorismate synthase-like glutamine amidotransferase
MVTKTFSDVRMLLIDNYDSFTYNLVQAFAAHGADVMVYRNDMISVADGLAAKPTHLVISPGPGRPENAGVSLAMIEAFAGKVPILGVCLGHQCIVQQQGGSIVRAEQLMHGKTSAIKHDGKTVFEGVSQPFEVGRYHSLCAAAEALPDTLQVTAETDSGVIMGVRHKSLPIEGVQFHPESVLTPEGDTVMTNFMRMGNS